jgi:hypothetical protein
VVEPLFEGTSHRNRARFLARALALFIVLITLSLSGLAVAASHDENFPRPNLERRLLIPSSTHVPHSSYGSPYRHQKWSRFNRSKRLGTLSDKARSSGHKTPGLDALAPGAPRGLDALAPRP